MHSASKAVYQVGFDYSMLNVNWIRTQSHCLSITERKTSDAVVVNRVATRPGFPGMSRICAMLSRVPARPAPRRQMSRMDFKVKSKQSK